MYVCVYASIHPSIHHMISIHAPRLQHLVGTPAAGVQVLALLQLIGRRALVHRLELLHVHPQLRQALLQLLLPVSRWVDRFIQSGLVGIGGSLD